MPMPIKIVPKHGWVKGIGRPDGDLPELPHPVPLVFFAYSKKDYTKAQPSPGPRPDTNMCMEVLNYIMKGDMWKKRKEIRYNFMLGPDGYVYEGRGWKKIPSLPYKFYRLNFYSLFISFIGDFSEETPSEDLFRLRHEFLRYGVEHNYIQPKFLLVTLATAEGHHYKPITIAN